MEWSFLLIRNLWTTCRKQKLFPLNLISSSLVFRHLSLEHIIMVVNYMESRHVDNIPEDPFHYTPLLRITYNVWQSGTNR